MPGNRKDLPDAKPKDRGEIVAPFSLEELVSFVEEHAGPVRRPQQEGEISIKDFMRLTECSYDQAAKYLNKMVGLGLMSKREASNGSKGPIVVFRKVER